MRSSRWCLIVLLWACSIGCGGPARESVTPTKPPELKTLLLKIAESGELEEVKESIAVQIEKIEETDAEKAKQLTTDFDEVRKAKGPAQIKAAAKKMADKL